MSKRTSGIANRQPESHNQFIPVRQSLIYRLRSLANSQFPNLFPHPDAARRLDIYRRNDPKENAQTTPPVDEFIDVFGVWAVEFYTPSQVDTLLTNLNRLGWDGSDPVFGLKDPTPWISRLRQHPFGGGWFNLGVVQAGTEVIVGPSYQHAAPLPPHVQYATGGLYSLTSSLICIVMGFAFENDYCSRFDMALRTDRETYTKPLVYGSQIHGPRHQKTDHICQIRTELIGLANDWFQEHLPGLFASGLLGGKLPTCEFVTLRKTEPFPPMENNDHPEYLSVLDLSFGWDVWRCAKNPGLKFRDFSRSPGHEDIDRHAVLVARESDLDGSWLRTRKGNGPGMWSTQNRQAQGLHIDETINGLLSRRALLQLLEGYSQHLNAVRDSTALRHNRRLNRIKALKTLTDHISYTVGHRRSYGRTHPLCKRSFIIFPRCRNIRALR